MRKTRWEPAALVELIGGVAAVASEAVDAVDTLHRTVALVRRHTPWTLGHVYVRDEAGVLTPTGMWHGEGDHRRFEGFCALVDAEPVHAGRGPAGRALVAGQPQWASDITLDRGFPEAAATVGARYGLGAAVAVPVVADDDVVAILEFFALERFGPAPTFLSAAVGIATILAGRVERQAPGAHERLHDPLTGLANRILFVDEAVRALNRGKRNGWTAAVLSLDLDRFRRVNDELGHDVGDEVLVAVGRRLEVALRQYDTVARAARVAARLGGDEFLLLCEGVPDAHVAAAIASRVLVSVAAPMEVAGHGPAVTASVGIALSDQEFDVERLIVEAETAMRRAKQLGGDRHEFFAEGSGVAAAAVVAQERRFAARPRARRIHARLLTSHADAIDKAEAFSRGADEYVVKPFAPRDLVARVRTAIRRRQTS